MFYVYIYLLIYVLLLTLTLDGVFLIFYIWGNFRKSVWKINFLLKFDKNNGYFT